MQNPTDIRTEENHKVLIYARYVSGSRLFIRSVSFFIRTKKINTTIRCYINHNAPDSVNIFCVRAQVPELEAY